MYSRWRITATVIKRGGFLGRFFQAKRADGGFREGLREMEDTVETGDYILRHSLVARMISRQAVVLAPIGGK